MNIFKLITGAFLAAFVGYLLAWYFGWVEANFSLILFVATVVTGLYWILEKLYFLPQRRLVAKELLEADNERKMKMQAQGLQSEAIDIQDRVTKALVQPWWLDWTAGFFPVILVVFLLRSFAFEPFKIPSGSMMPTLLVGDLILVNKFVYGLRLPVLNKKITEGQSPQRGDVMVFRYPPQPNLDYIKRVIGLPGDQISYLNKELRINGELVISDKLEDYFDRDESKYYYRFSEKIDENTHQILNDAQRSSYIQGVYSFDGKENCRYNAEGLTCIVPQGYYFMMGDNRDNSMDSRYWGFVPEENIVGKAFFIWMNFFDFDRIGKFN